MELSIHNEKLETIFWGESVNPLQHSHLIFLQESPFAARQILLAEGGVQYTVQFIYPVAERLKYPANDPVLS